MSLSLPTKCEFHLSFFICILAWTTNAQGAQLMEENSQLRQQVRISSLCCIFLSRKLHELVDDEIFGLQMMKMLSKGKRAVVVESDTVVQEEGLSSESVTNVCSSGGGPPSLEDDSSDTSLKLGYVFILRKNFCFSFIFSSNESSKHLFGMHFLYLQLFFITLL